MKSDFYVIKETDELIEMNKFEKRKIGNGRDGEVYRYNEDEILKLISSCYMTEEKIMDLREAVPENANSRIVVPRLIINAPREKRKKFKINIPDGYIAKYIQESKEYIIPMKTEDFLNEIEQLKKEINDFLSPNKIAILDTNPSNIIRSYEDQKLYLIDHDRDITPCSMYYEIRQVRKQDYINYNNTKLALIAYKCLLLSLLKLEGLTPDKRTNNPVSLYVESKLQTANDISFSTSENELKDYQTIGEYAQNKILEIKRKR